MPSSSLVEIGFEIEVEVGVGVGVEVGVEVEATFTTFTGGWVVFHGQTDPPNNRHLGL